MTDLIAVSISDAVQLSGIGRSFLYQAIARKELPTKKAGRRTLILMDELRRWLTSLPASPTGNA
jgi:excisionase family DNA binding protein